MPDYMGNYLIITGDNVKEKMSHYLTIDEFGEYDFDFNKIIPVSDLSDFNECFEKWGTGSKPYDAQVYFEGEGIPENKSNEIYFDIHGTADKLIAALSEKEPTLNFNHQWCEVDAEEAGSSFYTNGKLESTQEHPYLSEEAIDIFFEVFGRYDDFTWDEEKQKYRKNEEEME